MQSGLRVVSARGVTDEGDPWFVFCRADDDEVIIHFARIDGRYVISSPAYCGNADGYDFRALVRDMIERHPVLRPKPTGNNLFLHPAALLVMLVASAFLKSGHAAEAASSHGGAGSGSSAASDAAVDARARAVATAETPLAQTSAPLDAAQETLLLSAINAAIVLDVPRHTVVLEASAAPAPAPDTSELALVPFARDLTTDRPHDTQVMETSGITPAPTPQAMNVASLDPNVTAPAHTGTPVDMIAIKMSSLDPLHFQFMSDTSPPLTMIAAVGPMPDTSTGVQHVSLSGLSEIPQADKLLLQALGVPDTVAYAPAAPAAISTVIHAGVHTAAFNDGTLPGAPATTPAIGATNGDDSSIGPSAGAASASATSTAGTTAGSTTGVVTPQTVPETINTPTGTNDIGSVAPQGGNAVAPVADLATVMHIVLAFEAVEAQPSVLVSDHGVIFYDAAAISAQYSAVKSVTYDLGDGFSISLVGLPVELTHAGVHV